MKVKEMVLCGVLAAITAVCAQISIPTPFSPVPVTLQVLAVFLSAAVLGSRLGAISQIVYISMGAIGLPVFAHFSGGLQILTGITGGYLLSYPLAAYITGKIIEFNKNTNAKTAIIKNFLGMSMGLLVIYVLGCVQFSILTGNTITQSIVLTIVPFIIPDIIKILIASSLALSLQKATKYSLSRG